MNESQSPAPRSGKRRRWSRVIVKFLAALVLLLIIAWFVVTSSTFFKNFILPRVSKAANATITVDDAVISPFSHVVLRNLKIQTTGAKPLVTTSEVRIRYHLIAILFGDFRMDEVALVSPTVNLIENPDGTSNLDPLLKSQSPGTKTTKPATAAKSSKPLRIDLKKLQLTNATFLETKNYGGGQRDMTKISNVNITLDNLENGASGKLQLNADVKIENQSRSPDASANLQANIAGNFDFTLADDLMPLSIQGNTHLNVTQAGGAMQDLAALGVNFDCKITPTNITQVALRFQKADAQLGALQVNGPFNLEKSEGRLNVQILGLDQRVLNLFGAAKGLDFGGTAINSMNQIELAQSNSVITISGQFTVAGLQVTRAHQTTPVLDASAVYNVIVNRTMKTALLNALTLTATQNRNPLAHAELSGPMTVCWDDVTADGGDATLSAVVTGLNLVDWKPLLGESVSDGKIDFNAKLKSQSDGKQIDFDLGSQITSLTANFGGNQISRTGINLRLRGQVAELKQFKWDEYKLQVARDNRSLLTVSGMGTCEPSSQNMDIQVQLQAALPGLLELLPQTGVNISSGALDLSSHITQKDQTQTVDGTLALTALTGEVGENKFHNFGTTASLDLKKNAGQIEISQFAGRLTGDGIAGGNFQISGNCDLDKKSGQLAAKLADFNENGLRPFLQPLLGDKKMISVAVNAGADAQFDLGNDATVKANLQVTNFVVNDPAGQLSTTPLEAKAQLDVTCHKQIADLRQLQIILTPTARAKNELQLAGTVNFSRTNAIAGSLKLASEALDVTPYYGLFAAQPKPEIAPPPPTATKTTTINANLEPAVMQLPFRNFTLDAAIGRFYLDEVDVSNFQATLKLNGGRVLLNPFQLFLNGAPVNANVDLNLGVPGYQYNVSAKADRIPIAPLANSFSPAYKNKAKGDLLINAQVKGAGITGVNLQKNLAGDVGLVITNANIQLVGPKAKAFIASITRVAVVAGVSGMGELTNSALNRLDVQLQMGGGKIALTRCLALAGVFRVIVTGELPIAPVLDDSPFNDWPIKIAIGRGSAANADAFSDAGYTRLPTFVTLGGTLGSAKVGNPWIKDSTKAISKTATKIKNWLEKSSSDSTSTGTNESGTNAPPARHLLDFFKKK